MDVKKNKKSVDFKLDNTLLFESKPSTKIKYQFTSYIKLKFKKIKKNKELTWMSLILREVENPTRKDLDSAHICGSSIERIYRYIQSKRKKRESVWEREKVKRSELYSNIKGRRLKFKPFAYLSSIFRQMNGRDLYHVESRPLIFSSLPSRFQIFKSPNGLLPAITGPLHWMMKNTEDQYIQKK